MAMDNIDNNNNEVINKAQRAKIASLPLSLLSAEEKNEALASIAALLAEKSDTILIANEQDVQKGKKFGMSQAILDRLSLSAKRVADMVAGVRQVVGLEDPVGEVLSHAVRPNGLVIDKIRVPLGVIGMIYEARPNVTVDSVSLALKTGNAIILRGSSSALASNKALVAVIHEALTKTKVSVDAVQLIESVDHHAVMQMMKLNQYLDVLIPRGGADLIRNVLENSTVPVLETGVGNCHVFIDESADPAMAIPLTVNAKTHRPAVCNAAETLLIHKDWGKDNILAVLKALRDQGVELRVCSGLHELRPDLLLATEEDWGTEFLALVMAVKLVDNVDEAIRHINCYGTKHTEAIVTQNQQNAVRFMCMVDAAAVNYNASTRFTDGFEYGFGAEIGISTQKLHARGPMGLPELTSYKYLVYGNGQIRK